MANRFEERCYELLRSVPRGKVTTYSAIARALNSCAYRAVGNAMRKNMNRSIPCHRVVCSNGRIGDYNRGSAMKSRLLAGEGIKIKGGKIDLSVYAHRFRKGS